uniref:Secreted protein n=1 Tax=Mus musculus TaxID=10090 RepID=Q8C4T1_MOUSE|nr:unnamed protein product [Mus musculus]
MVIYAFCCILSVCLSYHFPEYPSPVVQQLIKEILGYCKVFPVTVSWRAFVYLLKPFLQVPPHSNMSVCRLNTFESHCVRVQSFVTEQRASPSLPKKPGFLF